MVSAPVICATGILVDAVYAEVPLPYKKPVNVPDVPLPPFEGLTVPVTLTAWPGMLPVIFEPLT